MDHLKKKSRVKERMNINREQFVEIAKFAQMYNVSSLLSACGDWAKKHMKKCKNGQEKLSPIQFYEEFLKQFNQSGDLKFLQGAIKIYLDLKYKDIICCEKNSQYLSQEKVISLFNEAEEVGNPKKVNEIVNKCIEYFVRYIKKSTLTVEDLQSYFLSLKKDIHDCGAINRIGNNIVKHEIENGEFFKIHANGSIYFKYDICRKWNDDQTNTFKTFFSAVERLAISDRFKDFCITIRSFRDEGTESLEQLIKRMSSNKPSEEELKHAVTINGIIESLRDTIDSIIECCPMQGFSRVIRIDVWGDNGYPKLQTLLLRKINSMLEERQNQKEQKGKFRDFKCSVQETNDYCYDNDFYRS